MVDADRKPDAARLTQIGSGDEFRPAPRDYRHYEPEHPIAFRIIVLMAGVALVGLIAAHNSSDVEPTNDDSSYSHADAEEEWPEQAKPATSADDGKVKVVEHGYSPVPEDRDSDMNEISWGAVLTNTSPDQAVQGDITLRASQGDKEGGSLDSPFPMLLPGETVTVGGTDLVGASEFGDAEAKVGDTQWWSVDDLADPELDTPHKPKPTRTSQIETGWREIGEAKPELTQDIPKHEDTTDGYMVVRCRVDSQYKSVADTELVVLFRDKDDEIIGSAYDETALAPGQSQQTVDLEHPAPEDLEASKVDVYAQPADPLR